MDSNVLVVLECVVVVLGIVLLVAQVNAIITVLVDAVQTTVQMLA